jgi:hypothetical protein
VYSDYYWFTWKDDAQADGGAGTLKLAAVAFWVGG